MGVPKETKDFQDWLEYEVGFGWFNYEKINVHQNTFFIRTRDEDGDDVYTVWSRGEVKYKGPDKAQAEHEFLRRTR